jgi:hypothetical protein
MLYKNICINLMTVEPSKRSLRGVVVHVIQEHMYQLVYTFDIRGVAHVAVHVIQEHTYQHRTAFSYTL